jgi:hypothetical protein
MNLTETEAGTVRTLLLDALAERQAEARSAAVRAAEAHSRLVDVPTFIRRGMGRQEARLAAACRRTGALADRLDRSPLAWATLEARICLYGCSVGVTIGAA